MKDVKALHTVLFFHLQNCFYLFIFCLNEEGIYTDVGSVTLTLILTLHLRANRLGTGDLVNLQIT